MSGLARRRGWGGRGGRGPGRRAGGGSRGRRGAAGSGPWAWPPPCSRGRARPAAGRGRRGAPRPRPGAAGPRSPGGRGRRRRSRAGGAGPTRRRAGEEGHDLPPDRSAGRSAFLGRQGAAAAAAAGGAGRRGGRGPGAEGVWRLASTVARARRSAGAPTGRPGGSGIMAATSFDLPATAPRPGTDRCRPAAAEWPEPRPGAREGLAAFFAAARAGAARGPAVDGDEIRPGLARILGPSHEAALGRHGRGRGGGGGAARTGPEAAQEAAREARPRRRLPRGRPRPGRRRPPAPRGAGAGAGAGAAGPRSGQGWSTLARWRGPSRAGNRSSGAARRGAARPGGAWAWAWRGRARASPQKAPFDRNPAPAETPTPDSPDHPGCRREGGATSRSGTRASRRPRAGRVRATRWSRCLARAMKRPCQSANSLCWATRSCSARPPPSTILWPPTSSS